jgi:hypothetical protein
MSALKRELAWMSGVAAEVDGPRSKRRRDGGGGAESSPAQDESPSNSVSKTTDQVEAATSEDQQRVREQGNALWQTIKDAVDKE